jgi:hypothetical protein
VNAVIDPKIEKNSELIHRVRQANAYLEPQLGRFQNYVEARWSAADRPGDLSLSLQFTDGLPGEASDSFSANVLNRDWTAAIWLRGVVDKLLARRADFHISRLGQMLSEFANEEANEEIEHAQAHVDGPRP